MPLRDHFRPPLITRRRWEGFHAEWPSSMIRALLPRLPRRYFAEPRVHLGGSAELDIATFEEEEAIPSGVDMAVGNGEEGGVATAVWAPPRPTLEVPAELAAEAIHEVRVFDREDGSRLVAAVEIVSPANKDRREHRQSFVAKCAGLLAERVSVVLVDVVTTRTQNLYGELLDLIGQSDPNLNPELPLYAAACRLTKRESDWLLETWAQSLDLGRPLPTVPLWLTDDLAIPLELEDSYEQSCGILNIP